MKAKLSLLAAALALSGTAFAAGDYGSTQDSAGQTESGAVDSGASPDQSVSGTLSVIDADGDGNISRDEWVSHFEQYDGNSDGSLDESEFAEFETSINSGSGGSMQDAPADTGVTPDSSVDPGEQSPASPENIQEETTDSVQ